MFWTALRVVLVLLITLLAGCGETETSKKVSINNRSPAIKEYAKPDESETLKFGFDLRLGPKQDVEIYIPFLRYISQSTGKTFSLRFTEKYEDTVDNLGKGITHFAALGPVNAVLAKARYGVGCLAMGLDPDKKPEYRSVIFTRTDSRIGDLRGLKGKSFAFGDKYSTQGHIIPRKMLENAGLPVKQLKAYIFSGSHSNTARAVLNGEYDAGGMQDTLARRLAAEGKIRILAVSKAYPSSLICFNKDVSPHVIKRVKAALLSFDPVGKHKSMLVEWDKTEMPAGFAEYKVEALAEIKALSIKYGLLK